MYDAANQIFAIGNYVFFSQFEQDGLTVSIVTRFGVVSMLSTDGKWVGVDYLDADGNSTTEHLNYTSDMLIVTQNQVRPDILTKLNVIRAGLNI